MAEPTWIWTDAHGTQRNAFALFRRVLELPAWPDRAVLHLFADARYRLRVNGAIVAYGPCRFVPAHPAFDSIDLKPWLRPGTNLVTVEAWAPNSSTYQTMPESRGGCIAWGEVSCPGCTLDLTTPGAWQARACAAWDSLAPSFSFAQGPVEILDSRLLPHAWFVSADPAGWSAPVGRIDGPWGEPEARSIAALGMRQLRPAHLSLVAALADDEVRVSCRRYVENMAAKRGKGPKLRFPYALAIRSPRAQQVRLGLFWGPHWVNGVELAMVNDPLLGNRQNADVGLVAGWNLLYGEPEVLTEVWAQYVAVPKAAGLELAPLLYGEVLAETELAQRRGAVPATREDLARLPFTWEEARPAIAGAIPARDIAWDRPGRILAQQAPANFPLRLDAAQDAAGWVIQCDFAAEFLGHAHIEIEAPPGTVIDIAAEERRRSDGLLGLYASNPFTDAADRVITAGGRQCIELFHPHGGRYLQITIRPPAGAGIVTVHGLGVRDHQVPIAREGSFACADPVFAWTWEASYRTLQACVEDAFLDCPWRERGTYLGDALVETGTLAAFSRDLSVAKRSLRLWAQGQLPDGQMQGCVPSWHRHPHSDFTLIWVLLLHDLWRRDGDLADAARWWPVVERIFASPHWQSGPSGLWNIDATHNQFIDWGVLKEDRLGQANACINAFRYRALTCACELAGALGRPAEAVRLADEAARVAQAFRERLWIADEGRFARCVDDTGTPVRDGEALHGNVLALAFGLVDRPHLAGVLAHIERGCAVNVERNLLGRNHGHLDFYFLSYLCEGLYAHGRTGLAEQIIREHYGVPMSHGAWTIWEGLGYGVAGKNSLCHAWSTTPTRWFHERVLGVRPLRHGDPTCVLIAPDSLLEWAEGAVPHPAGLIQVAWKRSGDRLELRVSAPSGVRLQVEPGPAFAGLRLDARIG
jgi:hypothetical protein